MKENYLENRGVTSTCCETASKSHFLLPRPGILLCPTLNKALYLWGVVVGVSLFSSQKVRDNNSCPLKS